MLLKEALYVLICACFWLLAPFQQFSPLVCFPEVCYCVSAFGTYLSVCLQMKSNYVQCISYNNGESFSQEEGNCCGLNKNVEQFTTFSALNTHMLVLDLRQEQSVFN